MQTKVYKVLVMFLLISYVYTLQSQCLAPSFLPASKCEEAVPLSQFFKDGVEELCFNNGAQPKELPPINFCSSSSVIDNPSWFSVLAPSSGMASILVLSDECSGGSQWAVYDQCHNLMQALACQANPVIGANESFEIAWQAEAETIYYIVIDGAISSSCNYYLKDFVNVGCLPLGEIIDDKLKGFTNVCPAGKADFSFGGVQLANQYQWTLDGIALGTTSTPHITFDIPESLTMGTYSLCVSASSPCDSITKDLCWDIQITDDVNNYVNLYICPGDSLYAFQDTFLGIGDHHFVVEHETACTENIYIKVQNSEPTYGPDNNVYVCAGGYYYHNGTKLYPREDPYIFTFENDRGCDSLIQVYVHEASLLYDISTSASYLGCDSSDFAVLDVDVTGTIPDMVIKKITWYDGNQNISNDTVYAPGKYYALVNTQIPAVAGLPNSGYACNFELPIDILSNNPSLVAPIIKEDKILCKNGSGFLIVDNHHSDVKYYEWTIGDKTIQYTNTIQHFIFGNLDTGWHQVKVQSFDDCGPGEAILYDFYLIQTPEIELLSSYNVYGKEILLEPTVSGLESILDYVSFKWSCTSHPNVIFNPEDEMITTAIVPEYGNYIFELELSLNDFCKVRKPIVVIFNQTSGKHELIDGLSHIHPIYPNPTSNDYVVSFETDKSLEIGIDVRDINGKTIEVIRPYGMINKGTHRISAATNHLPAGVYNIVYTSSGGIKAQRLIIIR